MHCDCPAFPEVQCPGAHGWQGLMLPGAEMNWPDAQIAHSLLPSASWNLPAGQWRQWRWPDASAVWKRPLVQSVHCVLPVASENLPAGQDLHDARPVSSENRSTAHGAHEPAPPAWPLQHGWWQLRISFKVGQPSPPNLGERATARARVCVPLLHVLEHALQAE